MLKVITNYTQTFQIKLNLYNLRNSWLSVFIVAAATLFFAGCEKGKQGLGAEVLPPEDLINFTFTDTTSLEIETIQVDSLNSYRAVDLLFGNYADPQFGRISATTYTELVARSGLDFGDPSELILDSVVMFIEIRDAYGRIDLPQRLEIFELNEEIPDDADANTNRVLSTKGPNLAQAFQLVYDSAGISQLYSVRLNNQFGEHFFTEGQGKLSSATSFREFFKGIAIRTEKVPFLNREPGAIFSVDVSTGTTFMALYYRKLEGGVMVTQTPEPFIISSSTGRYSQISRSETEGKLIELATKRADLVDHLELIQAGAYIKNYLKFPHLDKMPLVAVSRAEFILSVDTTLTGSKGIFSPPAQIAPVLSGPDKIELLNDFGFTIDAEFDLSAVASYDVSEGTYSFDLTGYVQRVISKQQDNDGLILMPYSTLSPFPNYFLNRAVFGGVKHPTLKATLNLTYSNLPR